MIQRSQWPEALSYAGSTNLQVGKTVRREGSREYHGTIKREKGILVAGSLDQRVRLVIRGSGPKWQTYQSTLRTQLIASDRTSGGEQRHEPDDGGSTATEEAENQRQGYSSGGSTAAALIDPVPASRRSSGGGNRSDVGGSARWRLCPSAAPPRLSLSGGSLARQYSRGGGLGWRAAGEGHQGGGDLRDPAARRSYLAGPS